tara:strand:+ start:227 stop:442 length:216 start_codon:yes stop_codon:yes gene_type:complete
MKQRQHRVVTAFVKLPGSKPFRLNLMDDVTLQKPPDSGTDAGLVCGKDARIARTQVNHPAESSDRVTWPGD